MSYRQTSPAISIKKKNMNTQQSDYVEIAYQQQIKKQRNKSITSLSSSSSLERSFNAMEVKMKKYKAKPELLDQKYMVAGFLQICKDYKKLILTLKSYSETLKGVLQVAKTKVKEDYIVQIDEYFEKHQEILKGKVDEYYKMKECLHRLMRMKIQEPYYERVRRKLQQVESHNSLFDLFRIYLEAFQFIRSKGYQYFKEDIQVMMEMKRPPSDYTIGEGFTLQIQLIQQQIDSTKDSQEGEILSKIFEYKLQQISQWQKLIIDLMTYRYSFNIRYNLNVQSQSEKIIKSKKLYEKVIINKKRIEQFLMDQYSMHRQYLQQLNELSDDLDIMKNQIVQWNIKLRNEIKYKDMLPLIKYNTMLKKAIKQLNNILNILQNDNHDRKYEIQATDIIVQVQLNHQMMKDRLIQYYKSKEIKEDEYLQRQFNKSIILMNYFEDIKGEIEQ